MADEYLIRNAHRDTPMFNLDGRVVRARIVGVHDCDTVRAVFEFGETHWQFIIRILHIDGPELNSKDAKEKQAGLRARNRLLQILSPNAHFQVDGDYHVKWLNSHEMPDSVTFYACNILALF